MDWTLVIALLIAGAAAAWGINHFLPEAPLSAKIALLLGPAGIYVLFKRQTSTGVEVLRLSEFLSEPGAVFGPKWGMASSGTAAWLADFTGRSSEAEALVVVNPKNPGVSNSVLLMGVALELEDRAAISRLAAEVEVLRAPEVKRRFPGMTTFKTPVYELTWEG